LVSFKNYLYFHYLGWCNDENLDPTANKFFQRKKLILKGRYVPNSFDDFTGQEKVLENLKDIWCRIQFGGEALDQYFVPWPSRLGKTNLGPISWRMNWGCGIKMTSGPVWISQGIWPDYWNPIWITGCYCLLMRSID